MIPILSLDGLTPFGVSVECRVLCVVCSFEGTSFCTARFARVGYCMVDNSFRSLASKGFPSGYSKSVCACVRMPSENSESMRWFSQTTPDEDPPTPPPCRWPALITLRTSTKFQLVWRRLCDGVLFRSSCFFQRTLCATRGSGWVVNMICIRRFCDHVNVLNIFDRTCIVLKSGSSSMMDPPDF